MWKRKGWTKLIGKVIKSGSKEAMSQLGYLMLENLRPISAKSFTPIHFCAENGLYDLLDIILTFIQGKDLVLDLGWAPLPLYFAASYAAKEGHLDILKLFVQHYGPRVFAQLKSQYPDGRLSPQYYAERNMDTEMMAFLSELN